MAIFYGKFETMRDDRNITMGDLDIDAIFIKTIPRFLYLSLQSSYILQMKSFGLTKAWK